MNAAIKHIKKNKIIFLLILLFFLAKLITILNYKIVWWDSAVYIGMGKYIFSLGKSGFWESSRPLIWPMVLGLIWKTGLNILSAGRILEIIISGMCILFTYLIGIKIFDKKTALLSSLFLAFSPIFFFFSGIMLTETASTLISLIAVYFFIDKKYYTSGIFFGIAFMTRYLQLFALFSVLLAIFIGKNDEKLKNSKKLLIGLFAAIIPFLILNQILYNNPIFPLSQQLFLSNNSGWTNYHPVSYYFSQLPKENALYLFFIFGAVLAFRRKNAARRLIAVIFLILFIFFNSIRQKEMRFLIILLPYMYLLAAFSLSNIISRLKNKPAKISLFAVIVLSFLASSASLQAYYKSESGKADIYSELRNRLERTETIGKIWISNPAIAVSSDKKIDNLMYYPIFNEEKSNELMQDYKNADFIFVDFCDLACRPNDTKCDESKNNILNIFRKHLTTIYSSDIEGCRQFVFSK